MLVVTTMQRLKAAAALLLTAYFAAAGAFHHHELPRPSHDHAGFCSAASVAIGLESCALCRVAHTVAQSAAAAIETFTLDRSSRFVVAAIAAPSSAGCLLLNDSRAPPVL